MANKGMLIILDGYGMGAPSEYNVVENANTPFLHSLKQKPCSLLKADSQAVGLLSHTLGGSEVGHCTIGAGRVILSTPYHIAKDIKSGEFKNNAGLNKLKKQLKKDNGDLHLVGLMSDKNVHSNIAHALAIIDETKDSAKNIYIHFITDGRDTSPIVSKKYLNKLKKFIKPIENCQIASIGGRFYYMDREDNLDRTRAAFNAMFNPTKFVEQDGVAEYIDSEYKINITDEFIVPISVKTDVPVNLKKSDAVMFFDFREDRVRQLAKMVADTGCNIYTMADVAVINSTVFYPTKDVKNTLCEYLSKLNFRQIKITETTKYAHLTYFFNGGREEPFKNEDRVHIPTIKTDDYASTPKMRAKEITDEILLAVDKNYDAIIVNYSNPDMIGHTGNYGAMVKSLEFLDKCVKKVVNYAQKHGYFVCITADHGNAEKMRDENGNPYTAHTYNPVRFNVLANKEYRLKKSGGLKDIAPTFLELMDVKNNPAFDGKSLIIK